MSMFWNIILSYKEIVGGKLSWVSSRHISETIFPSWLAQNIQNTNCIIAITNNTNTYTTMQENFHAIRPGHGSCLFYSTGAKIVVLLTIELVGCCRRFVRVVRRPTATSTALQPHRPSIPQQSTATLAVTVSAGRWGTRRCPSTATSSRLLRRPVSHGRAVGPTCRQHRRSYVVQLDYGVARCHLSLPCHRLLRASAAGSQFRPRRPGFHWQTATDRQHPESCHHVSHRRYDTCTDV